MPSRKFADILGMEKTYKEDLMNAILVSFHVGNYLYVRLSLATILNPNSIMLIDCLDKRRFARDNAFAEVEVATFCAIMKNVLERCVGKECSGIRVEQMRDRVVIFDSFLSL